MISDKENIVLTTCKKFKDFLKGLKRSRNHLHSLIQTGSQYRSQPKMPDRSLRPRQINVSYAPSCVNDEPGPSCSFSSSKKPLKARISRDTKNHSAVKNRTKPPPPSTFDPSTLPNPSWFQPLVHKHPLHKAYNTLPHALQRLGTIEPIHIFQLFFNDILFQTIATNTNLYAAHKRAKKELPEGKGRKWTDVTVQDIKCWLGIVIYMGVVQLGAVRDYWRRDGLFPSHDISDYMSQTRFEDIKRYLHITPPDTAAYDSTSKRRLWHQKVDPLLNQLRHASQAYRVPSSNIAIDEAIIRCTGRSQDTYKTPFKPIPQGLKFHCAADHGYVFDFHPTSNKSGPDPFSSATIDEGMNDTSSIVLEMTSRLSKDLSFNLYLDNYYTSFPLLVALRKRGIGACGTARTTSKNFPSQLLIPKNAATKMDYHYRAGIINDGVATMLWIDNAPVSMMTSIHQLKGRKSEVLKLRRKPGPKSSNAAGVKRAQVFSEQEWSAMLNIPACIDDYNHHMGGVDIADQYRVYYDTQLVSVRTWFPIFYWCTDTALINSFIIFSDLGVSLGLEHKVFRMQVAWGLILQSTYKGSGAGASVGAGVRGKKRKLSEMDNRGSDTGPTKTPYFTKTTGFKLPVAHQGGMHLPQHLEGKRHCVFCRWKYTQEDGSEYIQPPQTIWKCSTCGHALCLNNKRNCFFMYHTLED